MRLTMFAMRAAHAAVMICLLAIGCGPAGHVVPDEVSCTTCEIQVEAELQIGTGDGPGSLLGRPTHLVLDSLGRFWVTMLDYGFPFVFDAGGQFLQQVGSAGAGPGEFRYATVVAALPGDSVLLRATPSYLVVGPDLGIDRVIRGSVGSSMTDHRVASWPGEVVTQKITYAAGVANAGIVTLDLSGEQVRERGTLFGVTRTTERIYRRVEPVPAGMWVSEVTRYLLRKHEPDGTPEDSLERRLDWFPASERYEFGSPDQAPTPGVNTLRSDEEGRLWVYLDRPRSNWTNAWRGVSVPTGAREVRVSSLPPAYTLWRTVVEVIDPKQRRVVARKELEGHVFAVLGADRVATYLELENGVPVVTIHKLTLVER